MDDFVEFLITLGIGFILGVMAVAATSSSPDSVYRDVCLIDKKIVQQDELTRCVSYLKTEIQIVKDKVNGN